MWVNERDAECRICVLLYVIVELDAGVGTEGECLAFNNTNPAFREICRVQKEVIPFVGSESVVLLEATADCDSGALVPVPKRVFGTYNILPVAHILFEGAAAGRRTSSLA